MFVRDNEVEFTNLNMTVFKLFLFIVVLLFTGRFVVLPAIYILYTE